jgi:hypothetical protein
LTAALLVSAALSLVSTAGHAQDTSSPSIEDLSWIAGHWAGDVEALGGHAEEGWFAPSGGAMSGVFRLVSGGVARVFELLLIEQQGEDVLFRFKHVGPGWEPWEEKPLTYRLTRLEGRHAFFDNLDGEPLAGTPKAFSYARPEEETLVVSIQGWDGETLEIRMTRVP